LYPPRIKLSENDDDLSEYAIVSEKKNAWLSQYLPSAALYDTNSSTLQSSQQPQPAQKNNAMNKSVTNLWNLHKPEVAPESPNSMPVSPVTTATGPATQEEPSTPADSNEKTTTTNDDVKTTTGKRRTKGSGSGSAKRQKGKEENNRV
jgi:ribosome biogenesis ATPase